MQFGRCMYLIVTLAPSFGHLDGLITVGRTPKRILLGVLGRVDIYLSHLSIAPKCQKNKELRAVFSYPVTIPNAWPGWKDRHLPAYFRDQ